MLACSLSMYRRYIHVVLICWTLIILWFATTKVQHVYNHDHNQRTIGESLTAGQASYGFHHHDASPASMRGSSCLMSSFSLKAHLYLRALQHAVVIVEPDTSLTTAYQQKCEALVRRRVRAPLNDHAHSLELQFPSVLREISESARSASNNRSDSFDPLWRQPPTTTATTTNNNNEASPLFYYVAALPYHVVYCTNKNNNKEDWTGRDAYWTKLADQLVPRSVSASTAPPADTPADTVAAAFQRNMGADFILPASHPQLGPSRIHPSGLSYLHRASFLRTDFDVGGSPPKDVVVPYFLPDDSAGAGTGTALFDCASDTGDGAETSNRSSRNRVNRARDKTLLFFAGSDNPQGGYRSLFLRQLQHAVIGDSGRKEPTSSHAPAVLDRDGIFFSLAPVGHRRTLASSWWPATPAAGAPGTRPRLHGGRNDSSRGPVWYDEMMRSSKFCLVLRGDTTSSKRYFAAVAAGCVPVVVSDGLRLPFADVGIMDYSTFTLFFPESVVTTTGGLGHMLDVLRTLPAPTYNRMRSALHDAARFLLYRHRIPLEVSPLPLLQRGSGDVDSPPMHWSLFNPVTLALIEVLLRREQYCRSAVATFDQGSMCRNLLSRLENQKE